MPHTENEVVGTVKELEDARSTDVPGKSPNSRRKVAIIAVNYFSSAEVAMMVKSLADLKTTCDIAVCVVDNSCSWEEWARLQSLLEPLRSSLNTLSFHRSDNNSGFAAGNNAGYRVLEGFDPDIVIIINPDVIIQHADFDAAVEEVLAKTSVVFGAKTISDGRVLAGIGSISLLTGRSRELLPGECGGARHLVYPSGHFMAMRADTWKELGGLSEDFFLFGEEADTVMRLRSLFPDLRVESLEGILVSHTGGLTSGASKYLQRKSLVTFRHATRSSIILFRKHKALRRWLPVVILARTLFAVKAVFGGSPGAAKAVLGGVRSGLRWPKVRQ